MLHPVLFSVFFMLAAAIQSSAALAQNKGCLEKLCRAHGLFRDCDKPLNGLPVFRGRVVAVSKECSNEIISMQIDDGKAHNLPAVVEIDLGPCISFAGKLGDQIQIALREPPGTDKRRYHFACNIWGHP